MKFVGQGFQKLEPEPDTLTQTAFPGGRTFQIEQINENNLEKRARLTDALCLFLTLHGCHVWK